MKSVLYINSEASSQMTSIIKAFTTLNESALFSVQMRDKSTVKVVEHAAAEINLNLQGKSVKCIIEKVFFVWSLRYSLLSVAMLTEKEMKVSFDSHNPRATKKQDPMRNRIKKWIFIHSKNNETF